MTANHLQICREVLETAYREKLGIELRGSIAEIKMGRQPVWRTVSGDDLITEEQPIADGTAGLLLDPEIGLLSYVLPFHPKTKLRAQIKRALALRSQLSTERNFTGKDMEASDPHGSWRVILHWLVNANDKEKWAGQIMAVRRETAFTEELSLDAIPITSGDLSRNDSA